MSFRQKLAEIRERIDSHLKSDWLPDSKLELHFAIEHALFGGKRVRGFLAVESARLCGIEDERALQTAAAAECVHAYSLVHDDLPCMDDDAVRRGKPTVHAAFGEAVAVLVGDALQALAFELLADPVTSPDPEIRCRLINSLARAAGAGGMVAGQAMDMAATASPQTPTIESVTELQRCKTGALISWSAECGAVLAGQDTSPLRSYADALGLAYQIADDLIDAGRSDGRESEKATFVHLLGEAAARSKAGSLVDEACAALDEFGPQADALRSLARFALERDY